MPKKSSEYVLRLASTMVAIPIVVFCVLSKAPFFPVLWLCLYGLSLQEWKKITQNSANHMARNLGYVYINIACFYLLYLGQNQNHFLLSLLVLVWAADIFAFFIGRLLKGPKLAPRISPNKTISGALGGLFGAVSSIYLLKDLWDPQILSYVNGNFFVIVIGLCLISQAGDLLESYVKRKLEIKDSGAFLPGHGGILDRLDSLFAVSFVLVLWEIIR
ncbi:MAG TPA: phosphatidate cytidylyltransferase [Alphaproteobacteria bacterium]|nr:phosphatidate cytidylyltransferase [Alphaproteobacteria bacterium]